MRINLKEVAEHIATCSSEEEITEFVRDMIKESLDNPNVVMAILKGTTSAE